MKKYVGKQVEFLVEGVSQPFRCKVVGDQRDMVLVKGQNDTFARRIIKSKIIYFMPLEDVEGECVSFLVLFCENPSIRCPGVQFVKEGDSFSQNDLQAFMGQCSSRCGTCRAGSKGDLRSVDSDLLRQMMAGVMFGDYPETKETVR